MADPRTRTETKIVQLGHAAAQKAILKMGMDVFAESGWTDVMCEVSGETVATVYGHPHHHGVLQDDDEDDGWHQLAAWWSEQRRRDESVEVRLVAVQAAVQESIETLEQRMTRKLDEKLDEMKVEIRKELHAELREVVATARGESALAALRAVLPPPPSDLSIDEERLGLMFADDGDDRG